MYNKELPNYPKEEKTFNEKNPKFWKLLSIAMICFLCLGAFNGLQVFRDGLTTDTIDETTAGSGVTIDGIKNRDNTITPSTLEANLTLSGGAGGDDGGDVILTGGTGLSTNGDVKVSDSEFIVEVGTLQLYKNTGQIKFDANDLSNNTILQDSATGLRTLTLPDATDTLVGKATTDTLTNKTIDADNNTISNLAIGAEVSASTASAVTMASVNLTADTNQIVLDSDNGGGITTTLTSLSTAPRTITFPDDTGTLVTGGSTTTLTSKTIDADSNTITNIGSTEIKKEMITGQTDKTGLSISDTFLITDNADSQNLKETSLEEIMTLASTSLPSLSVVGASVFNSASGVVDFTVNSNGGTALTFDASETNGAFKGDFIHIDSDDWNVFLGYDAGNGDLNTGTDNFCVGRGAGDALTNGQRNIYIGDDAGGSNQGGSNCMAFGYESQKNMTPSIGNNISFGYRSMFGSGTGNYNFAMGPFSATALTNGSYNTFLGYYTGASFTAQSNSVCIGAYAGRYATTGSEFYVNAFDLGNSTDEKTDSLLYGTMADNDPTSQTLTINADTTVSQDLMVTGDTYTVDSTDYFATAVGSIVGWVASPTGYIYYRKVGKQVFIWFQITGTGHASITTASFPVPYACNSNASFFGCTGYAINGGTALTSPGRVSLTVGSSTVNVYSDSASGAWSTGGAKRIDGFICYFTD